MDGFAKAKGRNDIYTHAAECVKQINTCGSLALPLKGCTESLGLFNQETLGALDGSRREGAIEHILAVLGLGIREIAEARSVLVKALVERRFLVPAILVVVDVVVGLGVGKVELGHDG